MRQMLPWFLVPCGLWLALGLLAYLLAAPPPPVAGGENGLAVVEFRDARPPDERQLYFPPGDNQISRPDVTAPPLSDN